MRRLCLVLIALVAAAFCLYLVYVYPRYVKVCGGDYGLKGKFECIYREDPDFRAAVDELRKMVLDPEEPFDKERAFVLFNKVLSRLGLPEMPYHLFRYGKSVREKALQVPPSPACRSPPPGFSLSIVQPHEDVANGNGLEAVYLCTFEEGGRTIVEVTLVFRDEDKPQPNSAEDLWYDVWRLVAWGRVEDIETFFVYLYGSKAIVKFEGLALVLEGSMGLREIAPIGSGSKSFYSSAHVNDEGSSNLKELTVYVNTWNHALGLRDNNPAMTKDVFSLSDLSVRIGSRLDAENEYSSLKYAAEIRVVGAD